MFRAALRSSPSAVRTLRPTAIPSGSRRLLTTGPADKKKRSSFKGTTLRWGLAAAAVYFYNTSPVFSEDTACTSLLALSVVLPPAGPPARPTGPLLT